MSDSEGSEDDVDLEDPQVFVKHQAWRVLSWERPEISMVALACVALTHGLMTAAEYGALTLSMYLLLFQVGTSFLAVNFTYQLRKAGVVGRNFKADEFVQKRSILKGEEISKFFRGLALIAGDLTDYWEALIAEDDLVKVFLLFIGLLMMTISGLVIDLHHLVLGLCTFSFLAAPFYKEKREQVNETVLEIWDRLDEMLNT